MKRLGSSDSLGALMSICPTTEQQSPGGNTHVYTREYQSMLEGLDEEGCCGDEAGQISEKKRRLSVDQVKALEKNFEVENKLEPERKVKLAQELGLQPRQVAVWFQNRRARWKTKQLERDYGVLKANYDALKHSFDSLRHDNESLLKEIKELKSKLNGENDDNNVNKYSVKEETMRSESDNEKEKSPDNGEEEDDVELNYQSFSNNHGLMMGESFFPDLKDGSSDSDSSAILNEENNSNSSPNGAVIQSHQFMPVVSPPPPTTTTSMNCYQFSESKSILGDAQRAYQPQFVKIEEHNFFSGDEQCNFFSDEQAPTLQWYCHDQWN